MRSLPAAALFLLLWLGAPAAAFAQAVTVFSDDFQASGGLDTSKWPTVSGNYAGSPSGTGFRAGVYDGRPDGFGSFFPSYALYFRSTTAARDAQTRQIDTTRSDGPANAVVLFTLRYQAGPTNTGLPFDEWNSTGEEMILEYTTDGSAYTQLRRFIFSDTTFSSGFASVSANLPSGAWATTTQLRWRQVGHSGSSFDHWAIDDVQVLVSPEPSAWALFGTGLAAGAGAVARSRRRRRAARAASAAR